MKLIDRITKNIAERDADHARVADAGDIVDQYVIPFLPSTIDLFEVDDIVGLGKYGEVVRQARQVWLTFQSGEIETDAECALAFGTIIKTIAGLERGGWDVRDVPELTASNYGDARLTVVIKAERTIPGKRRWFRRVGILPYREQEPDRLIPLQITFAAMPETDVCRIVESEELAPSSVRTVRRVVCDGDGPAGLIPSTPLPESKAVTAQ